MNQSSDRGAVCEIELKNGRTCSVQAIGRCATCERAFCLTHQARQSYSYGLVPFVNMCAPCYATSQMEAARREQEWKEEEGKRIAASMQPLEQTRDYFLSGAACTALRKLPLVPVYRTETSEKKGFFGTRRIETIVSTRYGWCIGILEWSYSTLLYGDNITMQEKVLTVMLDQEIQPGQRDGFLAFVAVQPYKDGYKERGKYRSISLIDAEKV